MLVTHKVYREEQISPVWVGSSDKLGHDEVDLLTFNREAALAISLLDDGYDSTIDV